MPIHPQAQALLDLLKSSGSPPVSRSTLAQARQRAALMRKFLGAGPQVEEVRDIAIPGPAGSIGARVYRPGKSIIGTIVYLHGGGWVLGQLDDYDAICRSLALASDCQLISVDYRLAPEHPYPAAVEDAWAALLWIAANMAGGKGLVVAGDSAGGNLAAVVARRARDAGGPALALQVLAYPVTDHDFETGSYREHGEAGLNLGRADMQWFWNHYAPAQSDRNHADASPLRAASLAGLAPAYVMLAGNDPLRDEGRAYAEAMAAAGVPVTVVHYDDQLHGFFIMANVMDRGKEAVAATAQAIRAALGRSAA